MLKQKALRNRITLRNGIYLFNRKRMNPNIYLYHQTLRDFLENIKEEGLDPLHLFNESFSFRGDLLEEQELKKHLTKEEWNNFDVEDYYDNEEIMGIVLHYEKLRDAQYFLEQSFPLLSDCLFFYKVEDVNKIKDISMDEVILRVNAKNINCECKEANLDISNEIVSTFFGKTDLSKREHLRKLYRVSIRDLDETYNEYLTEAFCHCRIKPRFIEVRDRDRWIFIKDYPI